MDSKLIELDVASAVQFALGVRPAALTPLLDAFEEDLVYEARLHDGTEVVFKAGHDECLGPEAWACEKAREHGVPAPRVLFVDTSLSQFPKPFFVMEKIPGVPLWDASLDRGARRTALREAGGYLLKLHEIAVHGHGLLVPQPDGVPAGDHDTWREAILNDFVVELDRIERSGLISAQVVSAIRGVFERHGDVLETCDVPRLLHGDLHHGHILWHEGRVSGFIDFGDAAAGDPLFDIGRFSQVPAWRPLLEGYGLRTAADEKTITLYRLAWLVAATGWRVRAGMEVGPRRIQEIADTIAALRPQSAPSLGLYDREPPPGESAIPVIVHHLFPEAGRASVESERLGWSTYVWRVDVDGRTLYLRVLPEHGATFVPEALAHRLLIDRGVHVPDVIRVLERDPVFGLSVMVTGEIAGEPVGYDHEVPNLSEVLADAGEELEQVHQIRVDGYGWIVRDPGINSLKAQYATLRAWVDHDLAPMVAEVARTDILNATERLTLECLLESDELRGESRLAHGDFDCTHIYHVDGNYTGMIDFGEIRGAPAAYDLGHFALRHPRRIRELLRGYGTEVSRRQIRSWTAVILGVGMGRGLVKSPDKPPTEWSVTALHRVLASLT